MGFIKLAAGAVLLAAAGAGVALYVLADRGINPRTLGPYLERRAQGHNPTIERIGRTANAWLTRLDRGTAAMPEQLSWRLGAQAVGPVPPAAIAVASVDALQRAVAMANPGDTIVLLPGTYRIDGRGLRITRPGAESAPITLRGSPGARIESAAVAAITVGAPWWRIEGLQLQGVCADDAGCEHAFHVIGPATHFAARHNVVSDFNAHFKINGHGGRFPDHGLIESNTLTNSRARKTRNPVTPIDLVAASGWTVRSNFIADFVKQGGDGVSYGAFAKGAGADNRFERNAIVCEWRLHGAPGQRVGLSLGGGGTGREFCRERQCIVEQERGIVRDNLIASCSDDGLYLNNAAASRIEHNTLVDTGGVSVRFAGSSADVTGNLVDGPIRARDGGVLRAADNLQTSIAARYLGRHPWRDVFRGPQALDFRWADEPPRRKRAEANTLDLCGARRPATPRYGAFEDFSACVGAAPAPTRPSSD